MLKILVISNHYPPFHAGGYGILCYRLSEGLAARGHEVTVVTSMVPRQEEHPGGFRNSITVVRSLRFLERCNIAGLLLNTWRNHKAVRSAVRKYVPDLIYIFSIDGIGYEAYHSACKCGIPSVSVVGDTWLAQTWRDLPRFDHWISLANGYGARGVLRGVKLLLGWLGAHVGLFVGLRPDVFTPVHAISAFLIDDLRAAGFPASDRSLLIRVPLAAEYFSANRLAVGRGVQKSSGVLRALFVSRMERLKGPDIAIRALAVARTAGADATLTLAGIGADRMLSELNKLAAQLGVADFVFWQHAEDTQALIALYQSHDVFLFPSRIIEGLGMVCLEAMACGLPVLGTKAGGQMDLIENGVTGYSFEAGDYAAIGKRLYELDADRFTLEQLGENAMKRATLYHGEHVLELVEESLLNLALHD